MNTHHSSQIPDNISFDEASTFPIAFTTACNGLFADAPLGVGLNPTWSWDQPQKGRSALVLGANTSVGHFGEVLRDSWVMFMYIDPRSSTAIQCLEFLGFERIVAYASKTNSVYLQSIGATEIVDRNKIPTIELSKVISPAVDVVYDIMGAVDDAYDCLVDDGKLCTAIPMANLTREGRNVIFAKAVGSIAGMDVWKCPVNKYNLRPEHTIFGRLIVKNLPLMMEKGLVVVSAFVTRGAGQCVIPFAA